jgi:hypothetical protein
MIALARGAKDPAVLQHTLERHRYHTLGRIRVSSGITPGLGAATSYQEEQRRGLEVSRS